MSALFTNFLCVHPLAECIFGGCVCVSANSRCPRGCRAGRIPSERGVNTLSAHFANSPCVDLAGCGLRGHWIAHSWSCSSLGDFSRFQPGLSTAQAWLGVSGSIVGAGTQESWIVSGWTAANRLMPCEMWIFRSVEMGVILPSALQSERAAWNRIVAAKFLFLSDLEKWERHVPGWIHEMRIDRFEK